ncbi:MAG: hypothetical protein LUE98_14430 [Tannerellaceae bacterium]|nr:hypothetical protein [Tannerellaceae bacterium]
MKYLTTILLIFFLGCQNKSQQTNSTENNRDTLEPQTSFQEITISGNEPEPIITDSTYLINTGDKYSYGLPLKYEPNDESAEGSSVRLGEKLYIIEEKNDWLKVWANLHKDKTGNYYSETVSGSLYIRKKFTGDIKHLFVSEEDLPVIENYTESKRYISQDTLSFLLITKEKYLNQKANAVSSIIYDTLNIKKTDGKLILPCAEQTVTFSDIDIYNTERDESVKEYTYIGQIPLLNVYLIKGSYYESSDYFYIDKDSGEKTNSFEDFPVISPDGKYTVTLWGNPYQECTEFVLSKQVENKNIRKHFSLYLHKMDALQFSVWQRNRLLLGK